MVSSGGWSWELEVVERRFGGVGYIYPFSKNPESQPAELEREVVDWWVETNDDGQKVRGLSQSNQKPFFRP